MTVEPNAEDREHLSALSIGHFILGGVSLLGAAPILFYGAAGAKLLGGLGGDLSMALGNLPTQPGAHPLGGAPDTMLQDLQVLLTALVASFIALSVLAAVHLVVVGVMIRRRRWWTFCYLTGWGECLMFPFGTILGVFTIIVLGRPSVKRLFGVDGAVGVGGPIDNQAARP
ncbi:MAG: hypothetical protein PVH21_18635 [Myxococcales bacterium]